MNFNIEEQLRIAALQAVINEMPNGNCICGITVGETSKYGINIQKKEQDYYQLTFITENGNGKVRIFSDLDDLARIVLCFTSEEKYYNRNVNKYYKRIEQYHMPKYYELINEVFNKYILNNSIDNGANVYKRK